MLLLFPNLLDESLPHPLFLPASVDQEVATIDGLIAESPKGGRAFLRRFSFPSPKTFREIPIVLLNEHTTPQQLEELLGPLKRGEKWGLISDCGLPCLADPGAALVLRARKLGIPIRAFSGPSAITHALMLSGLSGQAFAFHGYLEKDAALLAKQIKHLEIRAQKEKETQLFIEAPYRNEKLLEQLLQALHDTTLLSVAWDLTLPTEQVLTDPVSTWKKRPLPPLDKKPALFLFSC